ncbi:BMP family ABC transporter substrate-binding protein [Agromyces atrinae]|uniref:BMP family ABC transporter substrate-binding protein n=1 Tax=Agromyces atrinae TaxID=592376 RepID=A0A4Q2M7Y4_9MICO|nr:BMP family ABC transporter substrate-binding protein [Agromyces atrinae]MCI2959615.1 BMP family ABC transporter substrate-binding protein [Agromyces atrinae]NYD68595.1 basic membrane protein A [Agromyces atrinae]RXZ85972.1 BMP family ABC transporter substrate-binding protein [Agromyces atrinae]
MLTRHLAATGVLAASVLLAGCAAAPDAGGETAGSDYCARMVTNSGGLEDRSFNQSSWEGLEAASDEFGIDVRALVSTNETDLAPNVQQAVESGCEFVLTVGWELADPTTEQAAANPDVHFAIVDELVEGENIKPIVFDTAQATFLAGYLAAGVTQTGVVATFGGGNQPPVTLFMDGFVDGVAHYNEVHGTAVRVLGWDKAAQDGTFTGDFEDINKGKTTTEGLIDQGADVILPVAGQVGEGAAAAALERNALVIWVDNDGYDTLDASFRPVILTSVLKNTQDAVVQIVGDDIDGTFTNEPFIGTLENEGVGLAPYHDLADRVSPELQAEIDGVRSEIIAGTIEVTSPSAP